ncbi:MAG TPA: outer membrane beta-barrel protein [Candidatus Aquilonibacter sp.]|nr:outer membrane beta-barrel protein [Candidatus Aquilonibacter sp.]
MNTAAIELTKAAPAPHCGGAETLDRSKQGITAMPINTQIVKLPVLIFAVVCFLAIFPQRASAQMGSHFEFGGDYNWVHSNAPPGGCGCFSGNGGDGWAGWRFTPQWSFDGEFATMRSSNISGTPANLTMYTFLGGPRFTLHSRRRLAPFGKVLVGGAHASGDLVPLTSGLPGSSTVFAMTAGGGADFGISSGLSIRLIDAEYLYTRFPNGTNNHQNNVSLAAGIVIRIGRD